MRGRRGGAELEEEDEEILVCFVVQSLCLFSPANFVLHCPLHLCVQLLLPGTWRPPVIYPPLPFALMCPAFAARYLEANIVFSPLFSPAFVHFFVAVFTLTFSF